MALCLRRNAMGPALKTVIFSYVLWKMTLLGCLDDFWDEFGFILRWFCHDLGWFSDEFGMIHLSKWNPPTSRRRPDWIHFLGTTGPEGRRLLRARLKILTDAKFIEVPYGGHRELFSSCSLKCQMACWTIPPFSTGFPSHVELLEGIINDSFKGGVILSTILTPTSLKYHCKCELQRPRPSSFSEPNRFNPFERSFGSKHCNGGFLRFF